MALHASLMLEPDLRDQDFAKNPYPTFAWLRSHHPVYQLRDGTYILSRYDDVKLALKRFDLFASGWADAPIAHPAWLENNHKRGSFLTETDPPQHTLYASIVNKSFVSRSVNALLPLLQKTALELSEKISQHDGEELDFLPTFAYPFTGAALRHITGLEVMEQIDRARKWIDVAESFTAECPEPSRKAEMESVVLDQNNYYDEIVNDRRAHPKDDLASILANASPQGRQLSTEELRTALGLFTTAGFQAPAQFLAAGIAYLAQHPEIRKLLKNNEEKIGAFTEEFLRLSNPAQGVFRVTTQIMTLHGITIPAGSRVLALVGAANQDPHQFPSPEKLDLTRNNIRTHLGFGHGVHTCLGAALARLEMKIAIGVLLNSFDEISCPPESQLDWYSTVVGRLLRSLPARFR